MRVPGGLLTATVVAILAIGLSRWPPQAEAGAPQPGPLWGVQVFQIRTTEAAVLAGQFAALKKLGIGRVYVRLFHQPGDRLQGGAEGARSQAPAAYFQDRELPRVADLLTPALAAGRNAGVEVWGWIETRRAPLEANRAHPCRAFLPSGATDCGGADLLDPEVQDAIVDFVGRVGRSGVAGLLLQDDFVLRHTEGASDAARRRFRSATSRDATPEMFRWQDGKAVAYRPLFDAWSRWKADQLNQLSERMARAAGVPLARNLMYEGVFDRPHGLWWLAHPLQPGNDWIPAVMFYHRQIMDEHRLDFEAFRVSYPPVYIAGYLGNKAGLVKLNWIDFGTGERVPTRELATIAADVYEQAPTASMVLVAADPERPEEIAEFMSQFQRMRRVTGRR